MSMFPASTISNFKWIYFRLVQLASWFTFSKIVVNIVTEYPKKNTHLVTGISDICRKEILAFSSTFVTEI